MVNRYILDLYLSAFYDIRLSDSEIFTLCQFVKHKEMYAAQVYRMLKDTRYKMEYKNVHKNIKSLEEISLIVRTNTIDRKHGRLFYRLTPKGVFSIFYFIYGKSSIILSEIHDIINGLLNNHESDEFFKSFIYPFFDKNTILKLRSFTILEFFLSFCSKIAHEIVSVLFEVAISDGKSATRDKNENQIIKVKVEKFLDSLNLKLAVEESSAKQIHFNQPPDTEIEMGLYLDYSSGADNFFNEYLKSELNIREIDILEKTMVFPIIAEGKYWSSNVDKYRNNKFRPAGVRHWETVEKDIILIVNDHKFCEILHRTSHGFNNCYNNILKLRR